MKTTSSRPAHVPPHQLNRIKLAVSLAAVAPQDPSTAPIEESNELDVKPGAHFVGLLAPSDRLEMAALAEDDAYADDDEEGRAGSLADRTALRTIVSKRILAARIMNGFPQTEAANLMGCSTPAQMSQWESGRRPPPLHMLLRASEVYCVSMDYLTGVSSDPDRDVRAVRRNATVRAVRGMLVSAVERVVSAIDSGESVIGLNVATLRELAAAAEAVVALHGDLVQRNVARVADRLTAAIERLEGVALKAAISLRRHDDEDARMKQRLAEIAANDAG